MSSTGPRRLVAAAAMAEGAERIAARYSSALERPSLRPDAVARRQVRMGEVRWLVKNPETLKYFDFFDYEWRLIELMDGTRTRQAIVAEYNALYSFDPIDESVVLAYEEMLRKIDLLAQSATERNLGLLHKMKTARQRAAQEKAEGFNIFFLLFKVLDPERFLNRTVRWVRWVWTPPIVAVWSVAVAWTVGVFILNWGPIFTGTYELYAFLRKPLLDVIQFFFILSFVGFFHEFGHAYATKIYGGEVHDIGIALLYFTPAFYCDTTDALLFQNKWHRLWVNTAGIYVEGFVCSAATAVWVASYPDSLAHEIAYKAMLFTGISTVLFNINPLVKIDGYYALTSLLEMPDLREESFRYIGAVFQKHLLRLPVEVPITTRRRRRLFWVYGTLALSYITVIMTFIGTVFRNLYNKVIPDFAVVALILTLLLLFKKRVKLAVRTGRLFYLDKKELLMSRRSRLSAAVAAAALAFLLLLPWTHRIVRAEAVLRPAMAARVEAPEDCVVGSVLVHENERVRAGDLLFRLESPDAAATVRRRAEQLARFEKAAASARMSSEALRLYEIERREKASDMEGRSATARTVRLDVRSPIAGRVLTHRPEDWKDRDVARGTLLAEIGDDTRLAADLPVSERLLDDVRPGARVRAFARQSPLSTIIGRIEAVAPAAAAQPETPVGLVDPKAPTEFPERFVARAVFENREETLRPGSLVTAKIDSVRASLAGRAWRVAKRWLQTIVW